MEKYKKVKVLGKGNFAVVILVQNKEDKHYYALKIIDVSQMENEQKEATLNEVKVLKSLRHPYIISYKESFMEKKCLCIVTEFADNGDLYRVIKKQREQGSLISEEQILDWFVQMALALKHIHDRKILHRDLKTQNIFLNSNNEIKIGDFGISRII